MHFQELVDRFRCGAGAGGDALLAAGLEQIGIAPFLRRHGIDDRHLTLEHLVVEAGVGDLVLHLRHAGHHAHQAADAAHGLHLLELFTHVGQIELAFAHFLRGAHRLFGVDVGGGFLDQRDDVAHAEDAAGDARGIELFQRVELFAGADQLDRLLRDRAHRQRRAAAAVAVDAGEHDAGQPDAFVERAREIDGVLAGQAICDQQHFVRIGRTLDLGGLVHHVVVERGAAGGVEHHHVVAAEARGLDRALGDLRRRLARDHRQRVYCSVAAEHGQLLHRGRTAHVE